MSEATVIRRTVFFRTAGPGAVAKPRHAACDQQATKGHVPHVSRLLALAIRFEELVRTGAVADYAEIARLGHVSRARLTQIMNLLSLAPDIQEAILFLPPSISGRDAIHERQLRSLVVEPNWQRQRTMWARIKPAGTCQPF